MLERTVGGWDIERELGRGGNGAVFRATHPRHGVGAVKVLVDGFAADVDSIQRFEREAQALARIDHPGVVRLLDHGRATRGWYVAMELAPGESLHDLVTRQGPLAPDAAVRLIEQLARACDHVHRLGLIHRDLKPHNVIVAPDGTPRLVDFGLVRSLDPAAASLTASGMLVGTPDFMSPEQVSGKADARSDIYGLGATLYFALTGEPPLRGGSAVAVIRAVLEATPERPSRRRRGASAQLDEVCLRCLRKDPAERPQTAAALVRELTAASRRAAAEGTRRTAAGVLVLLLAVGLGVAGWRVTRAPVTDAGGSVPSATPGEPVAVEQAGPTAYERGVALLAAGDRAGARAALDRAVADDPRDARALRRRAELRVTDDDHAGTIEDCTRLIELDARDAWAYRSRGRAFTELDDLERASADLERSIALAPDVAQAHSNRASLRRKRRDLVGALSDLERAAKLAPDDALIRSNLAYIRLQGGDLRGALAELDHALSVQPDLHPALINRANVRGRLGDLRGALADADRAIAVRPADARGFNERAIIRFFGGDPDGADADWTEAIRLDPRWVLAISGRGVLRARRGDHVRAVADLERALELDPHHGLNHYHLGDSRLRLGDHAGAVASLERARTLITDPKLREHAERALEQARAALR